MKVVNEELDAARRDVKTTESLSDTAKVQLKTALHQSKYVLLKSENDLTQAAIEIRSNPTSFTALADAPLKEE